MTPKMMMNWKRVLPAAAVTTAVVLVGLAAADAKSNRDSDRFSERAAHLEEMFAEIDTNADGTATEAEFAAYREKRFSKGDLNGDGVLSVEEIDTLMTEHRLKQISRRIERLDQDGSGTLDSEGAAELQTRFFARADRNDDGAVDRAELDRIKERMSKRHSQN